MEPVAQSSSLPKGRRVGSAKRKGAKSDASKLSKEDIEAIRKENKALRESGLAADGEDDEFEALAKAVEDEDHEELPAYKRRKMNSSAVMMTKVVEKLDSFRDIEQVIMKHLKFVRLYCNISIFNYRKDAKKRKNGTTRGRTG